jgi:hypothetical protein
MFSPATTFFTRNAANQPRNGGHGLSGLLVTADAWIERVMDPEKVSGEQALPTD